MSTAPTTFLAESSTSSSVPPDPRSGQRHRAIQMGTAGSEQDNPADQESLDAHVSDIGGVQATSNGHVLPATQAQIAVAGLDTATTISTPTPSADLSLPPDTSSQSQLDAHSSRAAGQSSSNPAKSDPIPRGASPGLLDPTLALLADVLDDLERTRIANENRLRQLTRVGVDKDGQERGFGLSPDHPDVARLAGVVDGIAALEHQATLNLNRAMRKHPLGKWGKTQHGVGEKQLARLLAAIGDPYWNTLHNRPRTVSELWAYCGLHVIRADQRNNATQVHVVGEEQIGNPDHLPVDPHARNVGVAARRRKGERANWSTTAKMRAYLIAESMLRAGNRETYDKRKTHTKGKLHDTPCVRCGPSGKPAQPGTPWSDGHCHADALRIVSKALLKDLWLAARDIHHGHMTTDNQPPGAEVEQP